MTRSPSHAFFHPASQYKVLLSPTLAYPSLVVSPFFAQKKKGKRRRLCSFFSPSVSLLLRYTDKGGGEEKAKKKKKKRRVTAPLFLPLPSLSFALCHTKAPPTPIKQGTQIPKPPCPRNVLTHTYHTVRVGGKWPFYYFFKEFLGKAVKSQTDLSHCEAYGFFIFRLGHCCDCNL